MFLIKELNISYLKKIEKDVWICLLLILISSYTIFNLKHWNNKDRIIAWDVISYYGYLPATFIYDDVTLKSPNENFDELEHTFWYHEKSNGDKVFKTSMGMAILYSPFFFLSHIYTVVTDGVASGFSPPYKFGLAMSSLFYLIIGLLFIRKILRKYYSSTVVSISLIFVCLGTNLYYYTVIAVGMPHLYLLALFSILIYLLIGWYEKPSLKLSLFLGLLAGLIVLVRPTMIVIAPFGLLIGLNSIEKITNRMDFFKTHFVKIIMIIIFAFIVWIPQFIYWKISSGSYLFYSYTEEGFFFTDPQVFNALFSFRKGWLLYTPIMIFALIGFAMMLRKKDENAFPIILTVSLYFYIASCWWDWWFGGSFGYRTMIEMFPLLAFGLACFIKNVLGYYKRYKIPVLTIMFLLLGFNLFQTRQAHEGLIHHDSMSKEAYFKILFKLQSQISREEVEPFLKVPDYEASKKGKRD